MDNKIVSLADKFMNLVVVVNEIYLYTEYFHKPNTNEELQLYNDKVHGTHLKFIAHLMYRNLIVELYKIFSSSGNDKLSIQNIKRTLEKHDKYADTISRMDLLQESINAREGSISIIKTMRDKIYAHTDIEPVDFNKLEITFNQINELIFIAKEFARILLKDTKGESCEFHPIAMERDRFILLKTLHEGKVLRLKNIIDKANYQINKNK